ncbi:DUF6777 domain-containing protein [Diaminobutyricibacter sp. McL0608]|uniref:DUF6777 domain-containing protein n=1 Tax=Leifsonia sp. McL0608 TaxID=3143537 RepID=UPI0031F30D50
MSEPTAPSKRRVWWWIAGAIVAVIVIAALSVTAIAVGNSSAGTAVTLVPSSTPGANPFTDTVAGASLPSASDSVVKKSAELRTTLPTAKSTKIPVATGTAPGLYGGSGNATICDPQKLVDFLAANPKKAAAWAHVLGISVASIPKYVASLTPVLLNSDTLVGNHGYRNGVATSLLSVLQAGTAVMVDATGTPRVKCNCGNPLTPPQLIALPSAHLIGPTWKGYAPSSVIAVQPGKRVDSLSLVDVGTGTVYAQPVGSGANAWVAASWASSDGTGIVGQTKIQTSADGVTWNAVGLIPQQIVTGLAWGGGLWVAVGLPPSIQSPQSTILTSRDLRTWTTVASVPGRLTGVAYGDGQWVAVGTPTPHLGDAGFVYDSAGLVYSSADGSQWHPMTTITGAIQTAGLDGFESVGFGGGKWIAVAGGMQKAGLLTYESADGSAWTVQNDDPLGTQTNPHVAYSPADWLITASPVGPQFGGAPTDGVIAVSTDSTHWQVAPATGLTQKSVESVGFGAGRWLATTEESDLPNPSHALVVSQVLTSTDGTAWTRIGSIGGPMGAIAYGGTPSGTPAPTPTPVPTAGAAPDCSAAALQAALTAAGRDGKVGEHDCSGVWGVAGVGLTDAEITQLFKWVDGTWVLQDRSVICAQNILPAELANPVCHSN